MSSWAWSEGCEKVLQVLEGDAKLIPLGRPNFGLACGWLRDALVEIDRLKRRLRDRADDLGQQNRELRDRCESERARADSNSAWAQVQIVEARQAERKERARCAQLFDAWTDRWRYDSTWTAGDLAAAIQNGNTVEDCDATTLQLTGDPLHPTGSCVCYGEGHCGWCHGARRRARNVAP